MLCADFGRGVAHAVFQRLAETKAVNGGRVLFVDGCAADSQQYKRLSPKHSMAWRRRAKIASPSKLPSAPLVRTGEHANASEGKVCLSAGGC